MLAAHRVATAWGVSTSALCVLGRQWSVATGIAFVQCASVGGSLVPWIAAGLGQQANKLANALHPVDEELTKAVDQCVTLAVSVDSSTASMHATVKPSPGGRCIASGVVKPLLNVSARVPECQKLKM